MSSADLARAVARGAVLLALAVVLAACSNVRPLYGPLASGGTTQDRLRQIDISLVKSRVDQRLRNELIFKFYGGESPDGDAYKLDIFLTSNTTASGVEYLADTPGAYLLQLSASYTLVENATGRTLLTGSSFANASYDFSQQRFANLRARRDAEDRAAAVLADEIRTKIAAYFASHG